MKTSWSLWTLASGWSFLSFTWQSLNEALSCYQIGDLVDIFWCNSSFFYSPSLVTVHLNIFIVFLEHSHGSRNHVKFHYLGSQLGEVCSLPSFDLNLYGPSNSSYTFHLYFEMGKVNIQENQITPPNWHCSLVSPHAKVLIAISISKIFPQCVFLILGTPWASGSMCVFKGFAGLLFQEVFCLF